MSEPQKSYGDILIEAERNWRHPYAATSGMDKELPEFLALAVLREFIGRVTIRAQKLIGAEDPVDFAFYVAFREHAAEIEKGEAR